jgi:hypothetical protein
LVATTGNGIVFQLLVGVTVYAPEQHRSVPGPAPNFMILR